MMPSYSRSSVSRARLVDLRCWIAWTVVLVLICSHGDALAEENVASKVDFNQQIRPIFTQHCSSCHGGVKQAGDVSFVYHTYRGFLIWAVQEEHRVIAPPDDALILLKRLLRFNLTWGMMSYGMLFIPLLASAAYFAQKRSIKQQQRA